MNIDCLLKFILTEHKKVKQILIMFNLFQAAIKINY